MFHEALKIIEPSNVVSFCTYGVLSHDHSVYGYSEVACLLWRWEIADAFWADGGCCNCSVLLSDVAKLVGCLGWDITDHYHVKLV